MVFKYCVMEKKSERAAAPAMHPSIHHVEIFSRITIAATMCTNDKETSLDNVKRFRVDKYKENRMTTGGGDERTVSFSPVLADDDCRVHHVIPTLMPSIRH